jgi:hypothetical protein
MECDHYGFLQIGIDFAIPFLYTCSCFDGQCQGTPALDEFQMSQSLEAILLLIFLSVIQINGWMRSFHCQFISFGILIPRHLITVEVMPKADGHQTNLIQINLIQMNRFLHCQILNWPRIRCSCHE